MTSESAYTCCGRVPLGIIREHTTERAPRAWSTRTEGRLPSPLFAHGRVVVCALPIHIPRTRVISLSKNRLLLLRCLRLSNNCYGARGGLAGAEHFRSRVLKVPPLTHDARAREVVAELLDPDPAARLAAGAALEFEFVRGFVA